MSEIIHAQELFDGFTPPLTEYEVDLMDDSITNDWLISLRPDFRLLQHHVGEWIQHRLMLISDTRTFEMRTESGPRGQIVFRVKLKSQKETLPPEVPVHAG